MSRLVSSMLFDLASGLPLRYFHEAQNVCTLSQVSWNSLDDGLRLEQKVLRFEIRFNRVSAGPF